MKKHPFIIILLFVLVPIHSAFATLLFPLDVNVTYLYNKHNSANPPDEWTVSVQGLEYVDVAGQQYVKVGSWNTHGDDNYNEFLFKSTENAAYTADGAMAYQTASVGTTWSFSSFWDDIPGKNVCKITAIESVTVPYGAFDNAYVHQVYFDPDDPLLPNTAYWYDYIVPGVGYVKQIDYTWSANAPYIEELVLVTNPLPVPVPVPATAWMFGAGLIGLIAVARRKI